MAVVDSICGHERTEIRERVQSNGIRIHAKQCLICGAALGNVKKTPDRLPAFDETLHERFWQERRELWKAERAEADARWFQAYSEYLASPAWARVRGRKLAMNPVCEGCGEHRASVVHHLTYAHRGAEFMFELAALCEQCHQRLHPDRDLGGHP